MNRANLSPLGALFCITLAASFAVINASASETKTSAAAPGTVEKVDIGGRKLQYLVRGSGSPTVVIEAGFGHPPVKTGSWNAVIDEISKTNRVLIYDRAGLGGSDPASKFPRTCQGIAEDLDALLFKVEFSGPYLLVGHSYGGMLIRVFADKYPDKVLGLVLVDSAHPDQDKRWLADALPPVAPNEPESVTKGRRFLETRTTSTENPERIDPQVCAAQVRSARPLGDKPVVILSHSSSFRVDANLPEEVSLKIEQIAQELQSDLKHISTKSTLRQSEKGGHNLPVEDPALVNAGIREALEAARKRTENHPQ